jgi:hypothetical protein
MDEATLRKVALLAGYCIQPVFAFSTSRTLREKETMEHSEIQITTHGSLRYLQRVDPRESFPEQRLREMYDRARSVTVDHIDGDAYQDPETETVLVVDDRDRELITVLDGGAR